MYIPIIKFNIEKKKQIHNLMKKRFTERNECNLKIYKNNKLYSLCKA